MKSTSEQRRSRVIIEKDFQYRFTVKICLIGGSMILGYGGLLLYMIRINYDMLVQNALIQMPDIVGSLQREYRLLSMILVLVLVFVIGFLFIIGLLLTQKIAGPLMGLQKRLNEFGEGRLGVRLRLRKDDEFHNIASAFNQAMETHDHKSHTLQESLQKLKELIRSKKTDEALAIVDGLSPSPREP